MRLLIVITVFLLPCALTQTDNNLKEPVYPIGDIRYCPTTKLDDENTPLLRMDVLPGLGFDNLRNVDVGQVYDYKYSTCQTSSDGLYILPDNVYLIPILNSEVDFFAEVYDHFSEWKSQVAASINVQAKTSYAHISGSFSTDYQKTKTKMVNSQSRAARIGIRYHFYSVHINPDTQLNPFFKSRILDIAANIQDNDTKLANYLTELLVRDYGTHVVTSVEAGAILSQTMFVSQDSTHSSESSKLDISASASATFFDSVSVSTHMHFSKSESSSESSTNSIRSAHTTTHGGPLYKLSNFSYADWENGILDHLVAIDRSGQPLYTAISTSNVPEIPDVLLVEVSQYIYKAVRKYYQVNTHHGCTNPQSSNFNFQANLEDGSCKMTQQNYTFGGMYQTCENHNDYNVCEHMKAFQINPLTSKYSCPEGYASIFLHSGTLTKTLPYPNCHIKCGSWHGHCHDECAKQVVLKSATYNAYWCALAPGSTAPPDSGYMFGGAYTSKEQNPVTKSRTCPMFYYPLHFGEDIEVCVSNDESGQDHSIPFGGFLSCLNGNALAASKSQFEQGNYPKKCPLHYSQFLVTVDEDCIVNYCSDIRSLMAQEPHPPILPPFKIKAGLSLNVSETLVIQGPYGTVWVKGSDGQWTQDDNGQTTGQEYLDSLSIQTATQVAANKSVRGQLAGIVVGTIIGTLVFVVFIFIIGCGVNKFRKYKKEKRSKYIDLENSSEIRELTAKIQN